MRISVSGTACIGKSTFVKDFLANWPMYKRSNESYRELLKKETIPVNKKVTKDGQWKILNCLIEDLNVTTKFDDVIFDRCPLDNLVYSLWAYGKKTSDIDAEFIDKCIPLVRDSMRKLDIMFFIPITKVAPVKLENKEFREIDEDYVKEIDNLFKAMAYSNLKGNDTFFPKGDSPPIIEVFGKPLERVEIVKLYVDQKGSYFDPSPNYGIQPNMELYSDDKKNLIDDQKSALLEEKKTDDLRKKIITGVA